MTCNWFTPWLALKFTLVSSKLHQPARDADDVFQGVLRELIQRHLFLRFNLIIPTEVVQDEDGRNWLGASRQLIAEFRFQGFLPPLKQGFLKEQAVREKTNMMLLQPPVDIGKISQLRETPTPTSKT